MNEEVPMANDPLTAEEQLLASKLGEADLREIDATILAHSADRWLKVARVVLHASEALENRFPGLTYVYYAERLRHLVRAGHLDSQGNLLYMRFSEVRLSSEPRNSNERKENQP
jgi:hypothetical protein